jgi:ABC-type sugar transport system substrate-binding protein
MPSLTRSRRVRTLAASAAVLAALSACSNSADADGGGGGGGGDGDLTLEMNVYSRSLPYFQDMIRGIQEVAEADGVTVDVTYGETDPQLQFDQLENALSTSPDGLLVVPVDPAALIPVISQASTGGIPVVTLANDLEEDGHDFQLAHVGQEYVEVGRQKAQYIVDQLGGQGTVGYIHGIRGLSFSESQAQGAMEVFAQNPGITLIDGPYAGEFSSDAGLTATENVLTANPDVDALYFDNDDIALGGILAAQQRNIPMEEILIIGTDGGAPALEAVGAGELDMTISLCGYATGRTGAETLIAYLRDGTEPAERFVTVDALTITTDSLAEAQATIDAGDC